MRTENSFFQLLQDVKRTVEHIDQKLDRKADKETIMVKRATRHRRGPATTTELALLSEINQRLERIENNIDEVKSVATRQARLPVVSPGRLAVVLSLPASSLLKRDWGCKYGVLAGNKGQAAQGLHLRADVAGDRRVAGRRVFRIRSPLEERGAG
ncbi:hypothetical protein M5585_25660 [Serratia ureilytica]